MKFPELPSDEEIKKQLWKFSGHLAAITVCECGQKYYMHRLGCICGGKIQWRYTDQSGSVLECGIDFSPLTPPAN